jgi:hypothetical protein
MAVPAPRVPVLIAILALAARDAAAAPRPLDRARVHGLYQDGEFEKVVRELAGYGKGACACTRDDSVFAEKHLAVVLAANPVTRELGRYHMHRLLELAPRADLLDMYIGEEVDGVFEKVRKEYALRAAEPPARPAAAPAPVAGPAPASPKPYSDAWARLSSPPAAPARSAASAPPARSAAAVSAGHSASLPGPAGRPARIAVESFGAKVPSRSSPSRPRSASVKAKGYSPWDQVASVATAASAAGPHAAGGRADKAASVPSGASASSAPSASDASAPAASDTSRPAWKEPGLWIGGGAAIAAIAFTLWQAGSDDGDAAKTYAVPAGLDK